MATPSIFVPLLQLYYHSRLLPAFVTALDTEPNDKVKLDVTPKHKSILLSAFNIVAEKCATVALRFHSSYLPILLEACNDENYEVKEEAAQGIRICAESGSQQFKHIMNGILSKLNILLQHPNQPLRSLENAKASDIAVSAVGRICKCHRDCIDASENEAKIMHEQLCLMASGSDMDLLGPENQNVAKIIAVFVEVIDKGNKLATPETVKTMTHLLRESRRVSTRSSWNLMLLSMNSQQQQLLLSLVSSEDQSS
ncbi:hypothetical protein K1719_024295 [Acacia pycnantha]|nr:hypothetical protein K1719_024295 [Acacia pycnantha]